jgi:signal transduction histidine kinase
VTVTGSRNGEAGRITVLDNGPGVPPDQRSVIFEDRVRGTEAAGSDIEGLGIGLATCARIIAAHGGRLGVDEAPGGGAAFWFELPLPAEERT